LRGKWDPGQAEHKALSPYRPAKRGEISVAVLEQLQHELEARLRNGEQWTRLEHDLIDPCNLDEEDKSALWLYGWAYLDDGPLGYQHRREPVLLP
jgi:hypothetical protein